MTVPQVAHRLLAAKRGSTSLDGLLDCADERVAGQRLRQKLDSSSFHGLHRHRYITVARYENDRHIEPVSRDALLQFETINIGKAHIEHQAARAGHPRML